MTGMTRMRRNVSVAFIDLCYKATFYPNTISNQTTGRDPAVTIIYKLTKMHCMPTRTPLIC